MLVLPGGDDKGNELWFHLKVIEEDRGIVEVSSGNRRSVATTSAVISIVVFPQTLTL